ncbi:Protein argonaute-1 [Tetrabaena socialis]|uniref:Protein argonaute-1 n=1 Tax=Tetrabaena socialis TaxID=47790 RepID=A0A2J7ZQL5_9CHLO|nr:Protein argonaute-1 [Tetrabaena socialis]|eukprot:PNH02562.1 Protein argonaute-1 [Tetrabaena socialis]
MERGGGTISMEEAAAALKAVVGAAHAFAAPVNRQSGGDVMGASRRPNLGTLGNAVTLLTNYFALAASPAFPAQARGIGGQGRASGLLGARDHSTAAGASSAAGQTQGLQQSRQRREQLRVPPAPAYSIVEALARQQGWSHGTSRFDGRSVMYLPAELLPVELREWNVKASTTPGGNMEHDFVVSTRLLSVVALTSLSSYLEGGLQQVPRDTMQVLDMVVRHAFAVHPAVCIVGQTFLYADAAQRLGRGNEIWGGFRQSLKAVQSGLQINMDTAFYPVASARPLTELMAELCSSRGPEGLARAGPVGWATAAKGVAGLKVEFAQAKGSRRKALFGLSELGADRTMFMNQKAGRLMSVAEYFANTGRPLAWPQLPCANLGTRPKPNFVPVRGRAPDNATANTIGNASKQEPGPRKGLIGKQAARAQQILQESGAESAWGLAMRTDLLQVPARVLPAPVLQYGGERNLVMGSGLWTLRDVKFLDAVSVSSWAVAVLMPREEVDTPDSRTSLWAFIDLLGASMDKAGMRMVSMGACSRL